MTFRTTQRIRFGDEDHAGIVYFPRFLHFFHCAFEDFFDEIGISYRKVLDEHETGWPAVHVEVDFQKPLRFGDDFDIDLDVSRLGGKSATFRYVGQVKGQKIAQAHITVACVDMKTFSAKRISSPFRELFEKHLLTEG